MDVVGADAGRSEVRERRGMRRGGWARAAGAGARVCGGHRVRPDPVTELRDALQRERAADRVVSSVGPRILDNLLSNAVNHTPPHTPIEVAVVRDNSEVVIAVPDDGPGVPDFRLRLREHG